MIILESRDTKLPESRKILISESLAAKPTNIEEDGETFIFEAICADFSGYNENDRLYDEQDYVNDHLPYLQEKARAGELVGELDHPDEFLVKYQNAVHIIRDIWYDEDEHLVRIKIELLDNAHAETVKSIVRKGGVVFISSRASGVVDKSGKVFIERIYTYDIVSEPGFKSANLVRIFESLYEAKHAKGMISIFEQKNKTTENIHRLNKSEMTQDKKIAKIVQETIKSMGLVPNHLITESLSTPSKLTLDGLKVESLVHLPKAGTNIGINGKDLKVKNVIKVGNLQPDHKHFQKKGIFEYIIEMVDDESGNEVDGYVSGTGEFMVDQIEEMAGGEGASPTALEAKINKVIKTVNGMQSQQSAMLAYMDQLAPIVEEIISHADEMVDALDGHETSISEMREEMNMAIDHSDEMVDTIHTIIDHGDEVTESINAITEHSSQSDGTMDVSIKHADDMVREHNNLKKSVARLQAIMEATIEHSDSITDAVNTLFEEEEDATDKRSKIIAEIETEEAQEEPDQEKLDKLYQELDEVEAQMSQENETEDIVESTRKILANTNGQKVVAQEKMLKSEYPWLAKAKPDTLARFASLDHITRKKVSGNVEKYHGDKKINSLITEAVQSVTVIDKLIARIPDHLVNKWKALNKEQKNNIIALFNSKGQKSDVSIDNFWKSVNLRPDVKLERLITEGKDVPTESHDALGYGANEIGNALR